MSRRFFLVSGLALGVTAGAFAQASDAAPKAQPSLAQLLSPSGAAPDQAERLADLLAELEKRPLHRAASSALEQARAALSRLPSLRASGASDEAIERRKQLVWAALLLADRLIARAEAEVALRALALRAREAEADAARVEHERDASQAKAATGTSP